MGQRIWSSRKGLSQMAKQSIWATKVAAIIQGGNTSAALAQIKVAPTVKDLQALRALLIANGQRREHLRMSVLRSCADTSLAGYCVDTARKRRELC